MCDYLCAVDVINSEEVTEEFTTPLITQDTSNQEENKQVRTEENHVTGDAENAANVTITGSINTTKVNCSIDKIYGPVEV